jgi:hypothetical protein
MEARTSKKDAGSSKANKGDKYWLGVSIKLEINIDTWALFHMVLHGLILKATVLVSIICIIISHRMEDRFEKS